MARPNKEGMDYFSHDTDASSDEKIEALRTLYGNDGYAFYFIMLERIYRTNDFQIDVSDAETREETFQILSKKVAVSLEKFEKMLNTALRWGCFDKKVYETYGIITSDGIKKRASTVINKRKVMKERYENSKKVSDAETREETMSESTQSKVKESKVKKSKEYIYIPEVEEVWNYYLSKIVAMGKKRVKTDSKLGHINARLEQGFTGQQLKTVIDNVFNDKWMLGDNPNKKEYLDIDNFMCNAEKIEKWLGKKGGSKPNGQHKADTGSQLDDDTIARLSI